MPYSVYKFAENAYVIVDPDGNVFAQKQTEEEARHICNEQNDSDILLEVFKN